MEIAKIKYSYLVLLPPILLIFAYNLGSKGLLIYIYPFALVMLIFIVKMLFGFQIKKSVQEIAYIVFFHFSFYFSIIAGVLLILDKLGVSVSLGVGGIIIAFSFLFLILNYAILRSSVIDIRIPETSAQTIITAISAVAFTAIILSLGILAESLTASLFEGGVQAEGIHEGGTTILNAVTLASESPGSTISRDGKFTYAAIVPVNIFSTPRFDYRVLESYPGANVIEKVEIEKCEPSANADCDKRLLRIEGPDYYFKVNARCNQIAKWRVECALSFENLMDLTGAEQGSFEFAKKSTKSEIIKSVYSRIQEIYEKRLLIAESAKGRGYFDRIIALVFGYLVDEMGAEVTDIAEIAVLLNIAEALRDEEMTIQMNQLHGDYFYDGTKNIGEHVARIKGETEKTEKKTATESTESNKISIFNPAELQMLQQELGTFPEKCERFFKPLPTPNESEEAIKLRAIIHCRGGGGIMEDITVANEQFKLTLANGARWLDRNRDFGGQINIRKPAIRGNDYIDLHELEAMSNTQLVLEGDELNRRIGYGYDFPRSAGMRILECEEKCVIGVES